MQVKLVRYERLVPLGQWENHRLAIEIEVQEGDDPNAVMQYAKDFVTAHSGVALPPGVQHPSQSSPQVR